MVSQLYGPYQKYARVAVVSKKDLPFKTAATAAVQSFDSLILTRSERCLSL